MSSPTKDVPAAEPASPDLDQPRDDSTDQPREDTAGQTAEGLEQDTLPDDDAEQPPSSPKHVFDDDIEMAEAQDAEKANPESADEDPDKLTPDENAQEPPDSSPQTSDAAKEVPEDVAPSSAAPASLAPSSSATIRQEEDDEQDLFTKLSTSPSGVPGLVTEWLSQVQLNGPAAVADLFSLVIRMARPITATPTPMVTPALVVRNEPAASIRELAHVLRADEPGPIPAVSKDPVSRRLRRVYEDFWRRLPAESSHAILFDTDCFDTLISWLEALAAAKSRALRMAACIAAYRATDGLIDFGTKLRKELTSMRKQLATEKRRCGVGPGPGRANGRAKGSGKPGRAKVLSQKGKDLAKKVDEWAANNASLIQLSERIFSEIYILKYRDVAPDIRALSVTSLGYWIVSYPDHYLDDVHDKYIGWLLSDKDASVRKSSVEVLLRMLRKNDFFSRIQVFLGSFAGRIVEMARDKDDFVAVEAIRVLTILAQYDALDRDSCETICDMVVEEPVTEIRRAAGEFLVNFVFSEKAKDEGTPSGKGSSRFKKTAVQKRRRAAKDPARGQLGEVPSARRSCEVILELLYAICKNASSEGSRIGLAVDAVWDHLPALRSWEAFVALLVDNRSVPKGEGQISEDAQADKDILAAEKSALSEEDKAWLCEMLLASARESSGLGDAVRKANIAAQFQGIDSPSSMLSTVLLPELSLLLTQFQADPKALVALVQLPTYFDMSCFERDGHQKFFEDIILKLVDITSRHTRSPELVQACAGTFKALLSEANPLQKQTSASLRLGCAAAAKELSLQVRADLSKSEPLAVAAAALRVRSLCELVEPSASVHTPLVKLLEYQLDKTAASELSDDVTVDAIRIGCATVVWSLLRVKSRLGASDRHVNNVSNLNEEEIEEVRVRGSEIVGLLARFASSVSFPLPVRIVCLQSLLTALTLSRGVENLAAEVKPKTAPATEEAEDEGTTSPVDLDLLGSAAKVTELSYAVRSCVVALLENQLQGVPDSASRARSRKKDVAISEAVLTDCFASLVQSSFQSVLAGKISHLPILGLLLKRRKIAAKNELQPEWTAYQLCLKYCQQRKRAEETRLREELKALRAAADVANTDKNYHVVRELAEAILATREPGEKMWNVAKITLDKLILKVLNTRADFLDFAPCLGTLSAAGFSLVTRLSSEGATSILKKVKAVETMIDQEESLQDQPEPALLETLTSALESVSQKLSPELPARLRMKLSSQNKVGVKRRKKKPMKDPAAHFSTSPVDVTNVRRSRRERNKIDYAKLLGLDKHSSDEETEESEDTGDGAIEEAAERPSAVDMARDLMVFSSSPRVPTVNGKPNEVTGLVGANDNGKHSAERPDASATEGKAASASCHVPESSGALRSGDGGGKAVGDDEDTGYVKGGTGVLARPNSRRRQERQTESLPDKERLEKRNNLDNLTAPSDETPAEQHANGARQSAQDAELSDGHSESERQKESGSTIHRQQSPMSEEMPRDGEAVDASTFGDRARPSSSKSKIPEKQPNAAAENVRIHTPTEEIADTTVNRRKRTVPSMPAPVADQSQGERRNGKRALPSRQFSTDDKENVDRGDVGPEKAPPSPPSVPVIRRKRQRKW